MYAEQVVATGDQPEADIGNSRSALWYCAFAINAFFMFWPSALLMASTSAISIIPRLIPCSSSPAPEINISRNISTIECTAVSLCPTPTVSINTTSYPAASHSTIVSRVLRATPPSDPAEGEGLINAFGSTPSFSIRVLSPRILP